jgi:hypothetical protein
MMPGSWLSRVGRRLLHAESFALMLSPAIADLQFETTGSPFAAPLHYCAVLRAFAGALWFDVSGDLLAMRNDLSMIAVLTAIQASYYTFMLVLLSGFGTGRPLQMQIDETVMIRGVGFVAGIAFASIVTSSACFWPPRRTTGAVTPD